MEDSTRVPEIHIVAGFLGAGKTTFLNRYLPQLSGKTVVIENEAGTVGVDGELLPEGFPVRELSAGCICCTLAPQLEAQLRDITEQFSPDQIVIEPSGVGNLSDIVRHCKNFGYALALKIAMVDASEFEDYADGFGTFYMDQIDNANLVLLTHLSELESDKVVQVADTIRSSNSSATVLTSDWRDLDSDSFAALMSEAKDDVLLDQTMSHHHHHHEHDHNFENNGFEQVMFENLKTWSDETYKSIVSDLKSGDFGEIYRAKGFVKTGVRDIKYFDFTPSSNNLTDMNRQVDDNNLRFIVIGKNLNIDRLHSLLEK